jgi:hypothetical protein
LCNILWESLQKMPYHAWAPEALPIYLVSLEGTFIEYVRGLGFRLLTLCREPYHASIQCCKLWETTYVQVIYIPQVCIANVCWHGRMWMNEIHQWLSFVIHSFLNGIHTC